MQLFWDELNSWSWQIKDLIQHIKNKVSERIRFGCINLRDLDFIQALKSVRTSWSLA